MNKALYGLKPASLEWIKCFTNFLESTGLTRCKSNYCLYKYVKDDRRLFLLIYVGDVLITGNYDFIINELINKLKSKFRMKNLGKIKKFLGLKGKL